MSIIYNHPQYEHANSGNVNYDIQSYNKAVDALFNGRKWSESYSDIDVKGGVTHITYALNASVQNNNNERHGAEDIRDLSFAQQQAMQQVFAEFEAVANVRFTLDSNPNDAAIKYFLADLPSGIAGWAWYPGTRGSDVLIDERYASDTDVGGYGFRLMMQETGHAMGLTHPEDNGRASGYSTDNTIMSYNSGVHSSRYEPDAPHGLQIFDIAAMQSIYGANHSFNADNTGYLLTGEQLVRTIWDGAGYDTYNAENATLDALIDLREGVNHVTKIGNTTLWTAFGANIESAFGGYGRDTLFGNTLDNWMKGGVGDDTLTGGAGNDILDGGEGVDTYIAFSGEGHDVIYDKGYNGLWINNTLVQGDAGGGSLQLGDQLFSFAWQESDLLITLSGNSNDSWTLKNFESGDFGIQFSTPIVTAPVTPTEGGETVQVVTTGNEGGNNNAGENTGNNVTNQTAGAVEGNDQGDNGSGDEGEAAPVTQVQGTGRSDQLEGSSGNDAIEAADGNDQVKGFKGNDTLTGGDGNDRMYGGKGDDVLYGGEDRDRLYGDDGNDTLYGGGSHDRLYGGSGSDTFVFTGTGRERDMVRDYEHGIDLIDLSAYGFSDVSELTLKDRGSYTQLEIGDHDIRLYNVDADQLTNSDFIF